jgi:hypothetical protein
MSTVWVLVFIFAGRPAVIDNIGTRANCEAMVAQLKRELGVSYLTCLERVKP